MNWTYSEYARLPDDGQKYEVIDGEVCVTPAPGPAHQKIAGRLYRILIEYTERQRLGQVLWDVDVLFVSGQFLRPDLVFVAATASSVCQSTRWSIRELAQSRSTHWHKASMCDIRAVLSPVHVVHCKSLRGLQSVALTVSQGSPRDRCARTISRVCTRVR